VSLPKQKIDDFISCLAMAAALRGEATAMMAARGGRSGMKTGGGLRWTTKVAGVQWRQCPKRLAASDPLRDFRRETSRKVITVLIRKL
jgi:hypothetical protein